MVVCGVAFEFLNRPVYANFYNRTDKHNLKNGIESCMTSFEGKDFGRANDCAADNNRNKHSRKHKKQWETRKKQAQQEDKMTEKARWMLEGSHGMARDADAAVELLEEKVKDGKAEAMWMLGVCCEFGMGTEQDVKRAEQLYKRGAEQGNATAKLLTDKLKNKNGRGCTQMDLEGEQEKKTTN